MNNKTELYMNKDNVHSCSRILAVDFPLGETDVEYQVLELIEGCEIY